jgi:RNA polymerase sigma-70 factor (ECF subfamily)
MERYASGDDAAFGELYDVLCAPLLRFVGRQVRSDALAEDLVQQTFINMHRARGQFIRGAEVVPWAFAIARRVATDWQRRQRTEARFRERDRDGGALEDAPSPDPAADDMLAAREMAERFEQEVSRLPPGQRIAFELLKQDGLSLSEAAAVLGITVTAVKLRAHRAYVALRAALGETYDEGAGARK